MIQPKALLPVIHVLNQEQALRNAAIAREAGCAGVFLINHDTADGSRPLSYVGLLEIHAQLVKAFPDWWLGVNCLDFKAADTFQHLGPSVAGLWVDDGEIDEGSDQQMAAEKIKAARESSGWDGLYFGGVAFKYQRPVSEVETAARIGASLIDVVTTSGPATGQAASPEKVKRMKLALGDRALALASGITIENIDLFLPYVDYFLVATGISRSFYELDPHKVTTLNQRIVQN